AARWRNERARGAARPAGWQRARGDRHAASAGVISVLVVAAYPTVRAGLRALVEAVDDCRLAGAGGGRVGGAGGGGAVSPVVVLVDAGALPAGEWGGLGALGDEQAELGLVVLVEPGAERYLPPLSRGRVGYLAREATPEAIMQAVRAVASGLVALDPRAVP